MSQPLAGAGQGLSFPQALYPANLLNGEYGGATNDFSLAPGEALPIPAGRWLVSLGKYCSLQYQDPVTGIWTWMRSKTDCDSNVNIWSDGYNVRIANLTGCAVGAVVTNGGSGTYVQSTTTVTPSTGTSTWQPIVGGAINTTTSITAVGKNYTIAPIVFVDAPPNPGVQATAVANISGGTVTSLTWLNQGAGYPVAPNIVLVPNPADPNLLATSTAPITNATALCSLTGAGSLTAVLLTNSGAPVASTMTLTVAGAGTTATVVPLFLQTLASATLNGSGTGYGSVAVLSSLGGFNTNVPAFTSPQISMTGFVPREAEASLVVSGGTITSLNTIYDAGLFLGTPTFFALTNGVITTVATFVGVLGSQNDTVRIQQLA